jgi:hypothetical protein
VNSHRSIEDVDVDVDDEESLFKELEEEDDQETYQFREQRFQEIQQEYAMISSCHRKRLYYVTNMAVRLIYSKDSRGGSI